MTSVDLRCPVDPRRLFARLSRDPDVRIDPATNWIEIACRPCGRAHGGRVLHRYDITGVLVDTITP